MLTNGQETRALHTVLAHLSQIVWRQQTSDVFTETILHLRRSVLTCSMCCNIVLRSLAADEYALYNLLLRCTHSQIRSQIRSFFIDCLKSLRDKEPALYGIEGADTETDSEPADSADGTLATVALRLQTLASETYLSTRGWDDFYLTLSQMVEMGHVETAAILNQGILEFCAKLFCMHSYKRFQEEAPELSRIMLGKRTDIFNRLIGFMSALLSRMDICLPTIPTTQSKERLATFDSERMRFPLTYREKQILLYWDGDLKAISVLDKMTELFDQSQVDHFYPGDIVKWMLESTDPHVHLNLVKTIGEGVSLDPPLCDAYIRAALAFCEACPIGDNVAKIITAVSKAVASLSRIQDGRAPDGHAVLHFLTGLLKAKNETLFEQRHPHIFHYYLIARSRHYAVPLLMHTLESVRKGAHNFLRELYGHSDDMPPDVLQIKWKTIRDLVGEFTIRIVYEKDAGILRSHLSPLIATCQALVQMLYSLSQSEDAELEQYQDANDVALIHRYQTEIEPRLRVWPQNEGTPLSTGEPFDQSDYGSESDDGQELLDM